MSGIHSRTKNDKCAVKEYYADSMEPADYALNIDTRVNPSFKTNKHVICANEKKLKCKRIQDTNATMNLGSESFGQRIDIEENLRGTNRIYSSCMAGKHYPCEMESDNRLPNECKNVVTVNPYLYERDIVPTNMDYEIKKGWGGNNKNVENFYSNSWSKIIKKPTIESDDDDDCINLCNMKKKKLL